MKLELWTTMESQARHAAKAAELAERAGWDGMIFYDSQNLDGDCYVAMALAATATENLGIGTGVTNPLTRHPAVTASAALTIQQISDGRAVLGIGRGDSSLAHIGRAPVYAKVFSRYLEAVQTYLRGESVSFNDLTYWDQMAPPVETLKLTDTPEDSRLLWLDPGDKKVPLEVAATGPKVIATASRHADHIMFTLGADTGRVKWGLEEAKRARKEAGLDPDGIKYGVYLNVVCHPDLNVARKLVSLLDAFARFSVMHGQIHGPTSRMERDVFRGVLQSFNMCDHSSDFDLPDEFVDRFAVLGPPDTCIARIKELVDIGIEKVIIIGPEVDEHTGEGARASELMTREVLPVLSKN